VDREAGYWTDGADYMYVVMAGLGNADKMPWCSGTTEYYHDDKEILNRFNSRCQTEDGVRKKERNN